MRRKMTIAKQLGLVATLFALLVGLYGNGSARIVDSYAAAHHRVSQLEKIDLRRIPEHSYYPGKVQIKITPLAGEVLVDELVKVERGYVVTSLPDIDSLNKKYSIYEFRPLLDDLYEISEISVARRELHREWEFHLWFNLSFDEGFDVIDVVNDFAKLDAIEIAEPVYIKRLIEPVEQFDIAEEGDCPTRFRPNDTHYATYQWALKNTGQRIENYAGTAGCDIKAEEAWEMEKGHSDVIVGVFDNGLSFRHTDLALNIWEGIGPLGENTPNGDHGTHVAGTIAAVTNNGRGVAGIAGGSGEGDGVKIMGCVIIDVPATYISRMTYAADNGAAISQNSWGYREPGTFNNSDLLAIDYFNNSGGGEVLDGGITIFAAGNDNVNEQRYPAYYEGALAVASTTSRDVKSSFSNYGAWIDVSAPGTYIANTVRASEYTIMSGTSMACPHVSGVAALVISFAHRYGKKLATQDVWDILVESTDNIDVQNPNRRGMLGSGRVNAYKALLEVESNHLGIRNPQSFTATAESTSEIKLSWQPNEDNNEVMLIWARSAVLGRPDDGTLYQVGHNIPGGGVVLYKGADTTFVHTELDAGRTYCYKAFSFNEVLDYSTGLSATESTDPPLFKVPFSENFDNENELPVMWQVIDQFFNDQAWEIGRFEGGLEETTGNYAYVNSAAFGEGFSQNTQLISPNIDISEAESVSIRFTHSFDIGNNSNGTLFYSFNGGAAFNYLNMWNNTTENPTVYEAIIPNASDKDAIKFRWGYFGINAQHWCIDDIEVFETSCFPPKSLTATVDEKSVVLSWQSPQDEDFVGFNLYRDGELVNEDEVIYDTLFVDTDVEYETQYSYYITTLYEEGESIPSNEVKAKIGEAPEEPIEVNPPQNLVFSVESYDVYLKWEVPLEMVVDSLLSYKIYRDDVVINEEAVIDTFFVDPELEPENEYKYYVTTLYDEIESEPSDTVYVQLVFAEKVPSGPITYLDANYPNPFNPETTIQFYLASEERAVVEIFNIKGRLVTTVLNETLEQGKHSVVWNGKDKYNNAVGSGIYLYKLTAGEYCSTKKMILMK